MSSDLQRAFVAPTALEIVQQTRGIRWWIREQIEKGKTDEEIATGLPLAVAFITGRISEPELRTILTEARRTTA